MAKQNKPTEPLLVRCTDCYFAIIPEENFLVGCSNKKCNPKGFKMGTYIRECSYFNKRR